MQGTAVEHFLATDAETHFERLAQIFRHDFILYAGMLLSWASLFEGEVVTQPEIPSTFASATEDLMLAVQKLHDSAQPHLYPRLPEPNGQQSHSEQAEPVVTAWKIHYNDFAVYMRPHLERLEPQITAYVARPEFETVIQQSLGAAAGGSDIGHLLFDSYTKLLALLDPDQFDQRIAAVMDDQT